jgi:SulP family sulfate permease
MLHLLKPSEWSPVTALKSYSAPSFRRDLVAGLTVAVVAVPQSMAYAMIAGVSPVYGLYTAMVQGLLAALFTSSSHLSTGPINTLSLLVASAVARFAGDPNSPEYPSLYLNLVVAMTLMVGLIQLGFAAARMASLVQYVSHSVIVGFTAGAGILIAAGQIPAFLGINTLRERNLPGLLGIFERMAPYLGDINWRAVGIGLLALAIVVVARMLSRLFPGPLLAAVACAAVVYFSGWAGPVKVVGALPQQLPSFTMPEINWRLGEELLGGALALALVGMVEAYSIAKAIATRTGERIDPDREFVAQGVSNTASSFFQCIPGSGSFSRSALNHSAGAATVMAGVYNSLFVAGIFLLFAPAAFYIPHAALAAILFVIAYGLIDFRYILQTLPVSKPDAVVCIATMVATLLIPLEFAILVGVFLNIGLYLRTASRLHITEIVQREDGPFIERPLHDRTGDRRVLFLQIEGDLFFALADQLQERLQSLSTSQLKVVILRLKQTRSMDATVLHVLKDFIEDMRRHDRYVLLCGIRPDLQRILKRGGIVAAAGTENVFPAGDRVFAAARKALLRARDIVGSSIDEPGLHLEDDQDAFTYQI